MDKAQETQNSVDRFLFNWHDFPFDYWWRKKYHIPFGSSAHREMSFIDMYIEWREDMIVNRSLEQAEQQEEEELGMSSAPTNVVKMSQQEIEDDYENLDLEKFNK
jgi:hypothetical protein